MTTTATTPISPWRAFSARPEDWFDPAEVMEAKRYARPLRVAGVVRQVLSTLAVVGVVASGVVASLTDGVAWPLGVVLALAVLTIVTTVVELPFAAWRELSYDKRWGFSTTTTSTFVADVLKGLLLGTVISTAMFLPLWAVVRSFDSWWIPGGAIFFAVSVLLVVLFPVVIAPMFNTYTPLVESPLRTRLFEAVRAVDADVEEILVEDSSKRDTRPNAYVAGLGASRRVVVYDTMTDWPIGEVANVVGHELGHWKLRHMRATVPAIAAFAFVVFAVMQLVMEREVVLDLADVESLGDPAALPLFVLLFGFVQSLVGLPLSWLRRGHERQADLFALEAMRDPSTYASMMRRLHVSTKTDLAPSWWKRVRHSHPPAAERIAMTVEWGRRQGIDVTVDRTPSSR